MDSRRGLVLTAIGALAVTILVLGAVALLQAGEGDEAPGEEATAGAGIDPALLAELADGGEVILFRHAITSPEPLDQSPVPSGGDCATERNLSAEGIEQSAEIGEALAMLDLDDGPFVASPFCRGIDTALAMLGLPTGQGADPGPVEVVEALRNTTGLDQVEAAAVIAEGQALLAERVGGPETVIMVSHVNNIDALTGERVGEGDAVVVGAGPDGLTTLGVIPADAW